MPDINYTSAAIGAAVLAAYIYWMGVPDMLVKAEAE